MKGPGGGKTDEISLPLALNFSGEADPVDSFFFVSFIFISYLLFNPDSEQQKVNASETG